MSAAVGPASKASASGSGARAGSSSPATTSGPEPRETAAEFRSLTSITENDAVDCGVEANDLVAVVNAGLPLATGFLVSLAGEAPAKRLTAAVRLCQQQGFSRVILRPFYSSAAVAARLQPRLGALPDIAEEADMARRVWEVLDCLQTPEALAVLGGQINAVHFRVVGCDAVLGGRAASIHPISGNPDEVAVWTYGSAASVWRVDRRTMRVMRAGEGVLDAQKASEVADLADRAQLALGRPVELEWCISLGRAAIVAVRRLQLRPSFSRQAWRRVAMVAADEGTMTPLAIDALGQALSGEDERSDESRVRRIYARPYRRIDAGRTRLRADDEATSLWRGTARAARVTADIAAPVASVRGFENDVRVRLGRFDAVDLRGLSQEQLVEALRSRHGLVVECFRMLERFRVATLTVLAGLEAVVGTVPRSVVHALAAPREGSSRESLEDALRQLTVAIETHSGGELLPRAELPIALQTQWDEARRSVERLRPLGIDLRPPAFGADDVTFLAALRHLRGVDVERPRRARRDAGRRLIALARSRQLGRAREALVVSLLLLADRVALCKGRSAESLAAAMLRLRAVGLEVGDRLVAAGVLDEREDAWYLGLEELLEALSGEPGAYTARVKLRREDDARWANYDAPRRMERMSSVTFSESV